MTSLRDILASTGRLLKNNGFEEISDLSTAVALTVPANSISCIIQNDSDADVRFRDDGTNPTSSVGMLLQAGASMTYDGELDSLKFIEVSSGAKLNVAYYG